MTVHEQILAAVQAICSDRDDFIFSMNEVVRALPGLNPNTVRTHVGSYCCVNARQHHAVRHDYFERLTSRRGRYRLLKRFRRRRASPREAPPKDTIHVLLSRSDDMYVAECHEIAVVTQGRTLDETLDNLREAIELHLEDGQAGISGISAAPRLAVTFETALAG